MRRTFKITSLLLALIFLLSPLVGCSSEKKRAIYSIDGIEITEDLYRYWLSYYKSYYDKYFVDIDDSEEGWKTEISDGVTAEQYVKNLVDERMKFYVCALKLYDEYDLELSDSEEQYIEKTISDQIDYYGGRSAFENALYRSCNITVSGLKKTYEIESKVGKLQDYLYGEYGISKITDADVDDYYHSNYSRIKYLYFDRQNKYVYDENGEIRKNLNGSYMTEELSEAEKADIKNKAEIALDKAKNGEDFNELISAYNTVDMDFTKTAPDGFYISSNSYSSKYVYTLVSEGMSMEIGEIKLVEDEYAYYVIAKYGLVSEAYKNDETGQFESISSYVIQDKYKELLSKMFGDVTVNTEYINSISLMDLGKSINI